MKKKFEITNNLGKKVLVSKEFAEAFKKAKEYGKSLGERFGELNEIPIEEFEEDNRIEKSE